MYIYVHVVTILCCYTENEIVEYCPHKMIGNALFSCLLCWLKFDDCGNPEVVQLLYISLLPRQTAGCLCYLTFVCCVSDLVMITDIILNLKHKWLHMLHS